MYDVWRLFLVIVCFQQSNMASAGKRVFVVGVGMTKVSNDFFSFSLKSHY